MELEFRENIIVLHSLILVYSTKVIIIPNRHIHIHSVIRKVEVVMQSHTHPRTHSIIVVECREKLTSFKPLNTTTDNRTLKEFFLLNIKLVPRVQDFTTVLHTSCTLVLLSVVRLVHFVRELIPLGVEGNRVYLNILATVYIVIKIYNLVPMVERLTGFNLNPVFS